MIEYKILAIILVIVSIVGITINKKRNKQLKDNPDTRKAKQQEITKNLKKSTIDVSIIVPCKNEINHLKQTVDSLMNSHTKLKTEIIVVDDGSTDRSVEFLENDKYKDIILIKTENAGAAEARNIGAREAKGDYLFFCDAHILVPDNWIDDLINSLNESDASAVIPSIINLEKGTIVGYGQTWTNTLNIRWLREKPEGVVEVPIACGCSVGIKRSVFEDIGGFHPCFEVWGKEDEEISFRLWTFGYKIVVDPEVAVKHYFRTRHPYKVTKGNVVYNLICLAYSHMEYKNISKVLNFAKKEISFSSAMAKALMNSNLTKTRELYLKKRKYDENFFFEKFNIPFNT